MYDTASRPLRHEPPERLLRRFHASHHPRDLEALVLRYRPLARSLARRYARADVPFEDLEQVAFIGLIQAIRRFDPARGFAFTTFAVPTILGELRRFRRETAWALHVPRPLQERVRAVRQAADDFIAAHGRRATVLDLADAVGCGEEQVREALEAATTLSSVSLDGGPPDDDGEWPLSAQGLSVDEPGYQLVEALACIEPALHLLPPTEREVLRMRFAEDLSHKQIGQRLEISPTHAARLLNAALDRLTAASGNEDDKAKQMPDTRLSEARTQFARHRREARPPLSRGDLAAAA